MCALRNAIHYYGASRGRDDNAPRRGFLLRAVAAARKRENRD